ncbi:MAG: hypothetical protein ABI904_06035 [Chloroflexota bacterium]
MKTIFEEAVSRDKFSMNRVYIAVYETYLRANDVQPELLSAATNPTIREVQDFYRVVGEQFGVLREVFGEDVKKIIEGIIRFSFFIEPVKQPKIETTKFAVRWGEELSANDPRYAQYEECLQIFSKLLFDLIVAIKDNQKNIALIKGYLWGGAVAYDLPIDYVERRTEKIHTLDNIRWFWQSALLRTIGLRYYLRNISNDQLQAFFTKAYEKIFVKAYLTDRTLTGVHKTNREKRWEVHPESVHFCFRRESMEIEAKLITQLCYFGGFPGDLQKELEDKKLISFEYVKLDGIVPSTDQKIALCPITLTPLSYTEFRDELLNPHHGKASYHVGHLHPLKALATNRYSGHTADNISWISFQGNRIQGELSVEETRQLMLSIFKNYKALGLMD